MSSISQLYAHFRACGQIGQNRTEYMNRALDPVKNDPAFKGQLAAVSTTYRHKEKNKALFVQAVLENAANDRDSTFSALEALNRTLTLFERASKPERSQTTKKVKAVKQCYISFGRVDGYAAVLQDLGCSIWQRGLPSDLTAKIISYLPLMDHFHASATCSAWYKAAIRPDAFRPIPLPQEIPFFSSFIKMPTREEFLAQRMLLQRASEQEPVDKLVLRTANQEVPELHAREKGDPIIFKSEHAIGVVHGNRRFTVTHDFTERYKVLSVAGLQKIFVVNERSEGVHELHALDTQTGVMTMRCSCQFEGTVSHFGYRDNKLWLLDSQSVLRSFDLETAALRVEAETVEPSASGAGMNHYRDMLRIFTSSGPVATFATEDLSNLAAGAHAIPNTQDTTRFTTITDRVLYASYQARREVAAFDRTTGEKLKSYSHSKLSGFWLTPGALISEGFLYLTVNNTTTEVYDLLVGDLITTITFDDDTITSGMQAVANKIIYVQGNTLRSKTIGHA